MIKLSSNEYKLKRVTKEHFWKALDQITVGQNMNPESGYTTQYFGKFDNIFAGRKTKDNFSIYLYRPIFKGFRTEILSKGSIVEEKDGIKISCSFEIPFWSFLIFLVISFILFTPVLLQSFVGGIIITIIGIGIYAAILNSNHKSVKKEIKKQFDRIEKNCHSK